MINILFVVPYPEMEEAVKEIFEIHPQRDMLYKTISVIPVERIDIANLDCDIVIARGLTFKKIGQEKPLMPKIELSIRALDIINALRQCQQNFNPQKIALISHLSAVTDALPFFDLINCPVEVYNQVSAEDIPETVNLALSNGCDAIVGGYSVFRYANAHNVNCLIITTSKATIMDALNEAIRTYEIVKNNEISKTVIEHCRSSIIHVGKDYKISLMNTEAQRYLEKLNNTKKKFFQQHITAVFPFMYREIRNVLTSKQEITNELYRVGDVTISATFVPIFIGDEATGVVVSFTTVEKIQHDEIQVRKKLSVKGLQAKYTFDHVVYKSKVMADTIELATNIASVSSNVLIIGETGTGKELFAQSIHNASPRKNGPFVAINCASLPENLIESELFGYIEGAFTGSAKGGKAGLIELAHNGTLFLDEISEVPVSFQSKLLRVLQEHEVRRLGDNKMISVDVRIISALNKDIYKLVKDGLFRKDLLYRLDILRLNLPPLRSRPEDVLELFMHFARIYNQRHGKDITFLTPTAVQLLTGYEFEGNIRELKNIVERICVLSKTSTIDYAEMHDAIYYKSVDGGYNLDSNNGFHRLNDEYNEKYLIEQALAKTKSNQTKAAALLGIDRTTLWRKIKKFSIEVK